MKKQVSVDARSNLAEHAEHCYKHQKLMAYEGTRYFVRKYTPKGTGRSARVWLELETPY